MGTGFLRTERSISVSAALLRQTSTVGVSLSSGEAEDSAPGITEVYLAKKTNLFLFLPPHQHAGFAKMNAGCVILACTLLVGASSVRWVNFYTHSRPNSTVEVLHCCSAYFGFCSALQGRPKVAVNGSAFALWWQHDLCNRIPCGPFEVGNYVGSHCSGKVTDNSSLASTSCRPHKLQCIIAEDSGFQRGFSCCLLRSTSFTHVYAL